MLRGVETTGNCCERAQPRCIADTCGPTPGDCYRCSVHVRRVGNVSCIYESLIRVIPYSTQ